MPDYFADYKAAIAGGQGAPSSPLGSFPEIQGLMNAGFAGPAATGQQQANNAQGAQAYNAGLQDRAQALKDELQKHQDVLNGKNFQQVPKADGGYDFIDPYGKKITVHQYAQATGTDPVSVLKSSTNATDQQFVNDYSNINAVGSALRNNDKASLDKIAIQLYGQDPAEATVNGKVDQKKLDKINADNAKVIQQFTDKLKQFKNGDGLFKAFASYYPHVYSDLIPPGQYAQLHNPGIPGVGYSAQ